MRRHRWWCWGVEPRSLVQVSGQEEFASKPFFPLAPILSSFCLRNLLWHVSQSASKNPWRGGQDTSSNGQEAVVRAGSRCVSAKTVSRCWKVNCLGKQWRGHSFFATFTMFGFGWYLILRGTCADRLHRHDSIVLCRKAGRYLFGSDRARSFDHYLLISSFLFFISPFHIFARFIQKSSFFIICSPIFPWCFPCYAPKDSRWDKVPWTPSWPWLPICVLVIVEIRWRGRWKRNDKEEW